MATKKSKRTKKRSSRDVHDDDIESRIFDVSVSSPYVRLLCYGKNGKGKTRLAASFPNCLILDVKEEGTRSAKEFTGTKVFSINSWDDFHAIYWYLQKGEHSYETVAIDTLTQMQVLAMRKVLGPNSAEETPRIQDWGTTGKMMLEMLLMFRNLPMHVIFLSQERQVGDAEEGEIVRGVPDLPNSSRGHAMGAVGIIGRIYLKEVKVKGKRKTKWINAMLVGPHEEYESKDRTGVLGRVMAQPSGPKIIKAWADSPGEQE